MKKLKYLIPITLVITALVTIIVITSMSVNAETEGYFTYTVSNGEATITGVDSSISGDVTIPSTLGGYPVTSLGDSAFFECDSLTSVIIPDSVTSIGDDTFALCYSLTRVTIDKNSQLTSIGGGAFYDCIRLTSIVVPDGVTSIGERTFHNCFSLTSIEIPDSVTSIGEGAFFYCSSLTSITVESGNTKYHSNGNCLIETATKTLILGCANSIIPADGSVTSIGNSAFSGCSSLTSINIPNGVTSIDESAFLECLSLTSIVIPDSVTSIGEGAFGGCNSLTSIEIPDRVTSIGNSAFSGCSSLTSINIPDSVTSIGWGAFYGCSNLISITVESGNIKYHSSGNCLIETATKTLVIGCQNSIIPADGSITSIGEGAFCWCSSLTSIEIPDSVTSIGVGAFEYCSSLTSIEIPDSVTSIGSGAFWSCSSLTSVTIGNSVTSIGNDAFLGCPFNSIVIPDSVTSIGYEAFLYCRSLTSVVIPDSVTSIDDRAFSNCSSLTSITVESGNTKYHSDGNCLIETDTKTLILGCQNSIIPTDGSVTSIGSYAFSVCSSLTSIVIPDSVTSISNFAFENCNSLMSIAIPDSVTSIGECAFEGCDALTTVYYGGNQSDWNKISIGSHNSPLKNANIIFDARFCTITVSSTPEGCGTAEGTGEHLIGACKYLVGTDVILTATANEGYIFEGWYENGELVSSNATFTFIAEADRTFTAKFASVADEIKYGDVNGDGVIDMKDVILLRQYIVNYNYETGSSSIVLGPQQ